MNFNDSLKIVTVLPKKSTDNRPLNVFNANLQCVLPNSIIDDWVIGSRNRVNGSMSQSSMTQ